MKKKDIIEFLIGSVFGIFYGLFFFLWLVYHGIIK